MRNTDLPAVAFFAISLCAAASAEPVPVRHIQVPNHGFMVARAEDGKNIARFEFLQTVQGEDVTMRLTYRFADGSMDEETTTFTQRGAFRLVHNHHMQKGQFFTKPVDFTVDAAAGMATSRTVDASGKEHLDSEHIGMPNDLANGFVGTLLLNVPRDTTPFRVGMVVPVGGGRLIRLLIKPESEQPFHMAGQTRKATVFRIHPDAGRHRGSTGTTARPSAEGCDGVDSGGRRTGGGAGRWTARRYRARDQFGVGRHQLREIRSGADLDRDDAMRVSEPICVVATRGELAPVEAEVHDQQRRKREGNYADGG